jgi:predicted membrane channel-forming protein YqfA (hemolysin III family)
MDEETSSLTAKQLKAIKIVSIIHLSGVGATIIALIVIGTYILSLKEFRKTLIVGFYAISLAVTLAELGNIASHILNVYEPYINFQFSDSSDWGVLCQLLE